MENQWIHSSSHTRPMNPTEKTVDSKHVCIMLNFMHPMPNLMDPFFGFATHYLGCIPSDLDLLAGVINDLTWHYQA